MKLLRESFLKTYASVPVYLRDETILVSKELGPISWLAAYLEIKKNTKTGKKILEELKELKLI